MHMELKISGGNNIKGLSVNNEKNLIITASGNKIACSDLRTMEKIRDLKGSKDAKDYVNCI